jgi:hypothetical protein
MNELTTNEKDSELISELKSCPQPFEYMRNRFYFKDARDFFKKEFEVEVNLPFLTPFSNLVNFDKLKLSF